MLLKHQLIHGFFGEKLPLFFVKKKKKNFFTFPLVFHTSVEGEVIVIQVDTPDTTTGAYCLYNIILGESRHG